ncbi:MAG: hypothetical protein IRY86_09455 [Thermorudis peleae]|nr:hypothetical protein [Thermorudis peleae]
MMWLWRPLAFWRWRSRSSGEVQIRPVRWHDVARWMRGQHVDLLEVPHGIGNLSLWALTLGSVWPVRRNRLLFRSEHPALGTGWIAVQQDPRPEHWMITQLLQPYTDDSEAYLLLIEEFLRVAGRYGVQRVHTVIPRESPVLSLFEQAGFLPFRRITVFAAQAGALVLAAPSSAVRPQAVHDGWAILRLYERVTPRPVVYAEARTRASWQPGRRAGWHVRGVVLPYEHEVIAYCQVRSRAHVHVVEVLADPSAADTVGDVLSAALRGARPVPTDLVLALVPEDALGLPEAFRRLGFAPVDERVWVARYLTRMARVRLPRAAAPVLRELPELVPGVFRGLPQRQFSKSRSHYTLC